MSFEHVARLLLPVDGRAAAIIEADARWAPPRAPGATAVIWGREPTWKSAGPPLVRHAVRRERALASLRTRPRGSLRLAGVHRWGSRFHRARFANGLMWRLREGAIVELGAAPRPRRVLDDVAEAAGIGPRVGRLHIAAGGAITASAARDRAVLRVGITGSIADPSPSASGLRRLAGLRHPCVPELLGQGADGRAAWTLESMLAGRPPARLSEANVRAVSDFCLQLPAEPAAPTAFGGHVARLAELLPGHADALGELEARTAPRLEGLPSVLAHGDLWTGNVLMEGERLRGVIDWETWHPGAVPGTDVLHLVAAELATRSQRTFAELLSERPWRSPLLHGPAMCRYWYSLEVDPSDALLEAVSTAWWAGQTAIRLGRRPEDATDPVWRGRNVLPALRAASRG